MSGSNNDHLRRDGDRPDEMGDIFRILSSQQLNVLYGVLTNNSRRTVFMDQLQDIVVANADSVARSGPPRKAMPKNTAKESTVLRPRCPSTAPRPYRPPRSSIMWRPNVYFCDVTAAAAATSSGVPQVLMILDLVASIRLKLSVQRLLEMQFPKASFDIIVDLALAQGLEVLLLNLYTSCVVCCGWSQQ